jgi:hypothetical protein
MKLWIPLGNMILSYDFSAKVECEPQDMLSCYKTILQEKLQGAAQTIFRLILTKTQTNHV